MENENNQNFDEEQNQKIMQNQMEGQEEEMDNNQEDNENELMYIYEWVDSIELSRPKKKYCKRFFRWRAFG